MFYFVEFILLGLGLFAFKQKIYTLMTFSFTWLFSWLILGEDNFTMLQEKTVYLIAIMLFCVASGILLSKKHNTIKNSPKTLLLDNNFIIKLLSILFLIFLYYSTLTIRNSGGINLHEIRTMNHAGNEDSALKGYTATFLFLLVAQPLLTAIAMLQIYCYYKRQKISRIIVVLTVLDALMFLITSAGRIFIIVIVSFFLAMYFLNLRKKNIKINTKKIVLYGSVLFLFLNLMTQSRNESNEMSFSNQMQEYIGCAIINMDQEISNLDKNFDRNLFNMGFYALGGYLYYPIKVINILLGGKIPIPQEHLEYLQTIKVITFNGRDIYYNALVPNVFYYYFDSGIIGVAFFSFFAGWYIGKYENSADTSFFRFSLYAIGIYYLIFSAMGSQFWKPYLPVTSIWCYWLSKKMSRFNFHQDN